MCQHFPCTVLPKWVLYRPRDVADRVRGLDYRFKAVDVQIRAAHTKRTRHALVELHAHCADRKLQFPFTLTVPTAKCDHAVLRPQIVPVVVTTWWRCRWGLHPADIIGTSAASSIIRARAAVGRDCCCGWR